MENRKILEKQGKLLDEIDNLILNRKVKFVPKIKRVNYCKANKRAKNIENSVKEFTNKTSCTEKELILLLDGLIEHFNRKVSN